MKATKSASWSKAAGEGAGVFLIEFYKCEP
jgi:hypothetical protein